MALWRAPLAPVVGRFRPDLAAAVWGLIPTIPQKAYRGSHIVITTIINVPISSPAPWHLVAGSACHRTVRILGSRRAASAMKSVRLGGTP